MIKSLSLVITPLAGQVPLPNLAQLLFEYSGWRLKYWRSLALFVMSCSWSQFVSCSQRMAWFCVSVLED